MAYVFYNPNPTQKYKKDGTPKRWNKGDCVIRALCKATGFSWKEVMEVLCNHAMEICDMPNSDVNIEWYLNKIGFQKCGFTRRGDKPTVEEFANEHRTGTYVLRVSGHVVTVQDGSYYDCWNSGEYKVRSYYEVA